MTGGVAPSDAAQIANDPDAALVERARGGDQHAFAELIGRHQRRVFGYTTRMLGDRDLADDATQETFIAVNNAIANFRGGSFRGWLLRIAHNKALDLIRARGRRAADSLDSATAEAADDDAGGSPDAWVDQAALTDLLERAIAELPDEQRAAVLLRDREGLAYQEIAEILTVDLGTVKSRIARGRRRIRGHLVAHRELLPTDVRLPR